MVAIVAVVTIVINIKITTASTVSIVAIVAVVAIVINIIITTASIASVPLPAPIVWRTCLSSQPDRPEQSRWVCQRTENNIAIEMILFEMVYIF